MSDRSDVSDGSGSSGLPVYRRMTPSEDLLATLLGIEVLVRQRQQLVDQLVAAHSDLARRNEIGKLLEFSKNIDDILRTKGIPVMTPHNARKESKEMSSSPSNSTDWPDFSVRNMDPDSGIRSLQKMLHVDVVVPRRKRSGKT